MKLQSARLSSSSTDSDAIAALNSRCKGKTRLERVRIQKKAVEDNELFLNSVTLVLRKHSKDVESCLNRLKVISKFLVTW